MKTGQDTHFFHYLQYFQDSQNCCLLDLIVLQWTSGYINFLIIHHTSKTLCGCIKAELTSALEGGEQSTSYHPLPPT